VRVADLRAALALWRYCEDSARYIFGGKLGDHAADRLLEALRETPAGLTRSDMRSLLGNRIASERIDTALELLHEHGFAAAKREPTDGRPAERWHALHVEETEKTEESQVPGRLPSVPSTISTNASDDEADQRPSLFQALDPDVELARLSEKFGGDAK
jgi:hypothetical protein